jgi:hypothetical protein
MPTCVLDAYSCPAHAGGSSLQPGMVYRHFRSMRSGVLCIAPSTYSVHMGEMRVAARILGWGHPCGTM